MLREAARVVVYTALWIALGCCVGLAFTRAPTAMRCPASGTVTVEREGAELVVRCGP